MKTYLKKFRSCMHICREILVNTQNKYWKSWKTQLCDWACRTEKSHPASKMFTLDNLLCSAHSTNFIDVMIKTNLMMLFHGKMSENILTKMWADYWQHEGTELWNYLVVSWHPLGPCWDLQKTLVWYWRNLAKGPCLEYWNLMQMFHTWKKIWESD
jgi:hypothetical protein